MKEARMELFIPNDLKDEPIICNMIRNYQVDMKIVEASFSAESGWALIDIKGEDKEVQSMVSELKSDGITVGFR